MSVVLATDDSKNSALIALYGSAEKNCCIASLSGKYIVKTRLISWPVWLLRTSAKWGRPWRAWRATIPIRAKCSSATMAGTHHAPVASGGEPAPRRSRQCTLRWFVYRPSVGQAMRATAERTPGFSPGKERRIVATESERRGPTPRSRRPAHDCRARLTPGVRPRVSALGLGDVSPTVEDAAASPR